MPVERLVIGAEHDDSLFQRLDDVLQSLGYRLEPDKAWHGMAGSQEVSHLEFASSRGRLIVEAETYVGLGVRGPEELVREIRNHFPTARWQAVRADG